MNIIQLSNFFKLKNIFHGLLQTIHVPLKKIQISSQRLLKRRSLCLSLCCFLFQPFILYYQRSLQSSYSVYLINKYYWQNCIHHIILHIRFSMQQKEGKQTFILSLIRRQTERVYSISKLKRTCLTFYQTWA